MSRLLGGLIENPGNISAKTNENPTQPIFTESQLPKIIAPTAMNKGIDENSR